MTLNQVLKKISDFQASHGQLNGYGFGEIEDFASSGTTQYPQLWVEPLPFNIGDNTYTIGLRAYFLDRLQEGKLNNQEVLSDMQQVAIDFFAYFNNNSFSSDFRQTRLEQEGSFTPVFDKAKDDEVAGWYVDISFRQPYKHDRCIIPTR
jgi:cytochrome c